MSEARILLDHGEEGVGLEILLSNLFEIDFVLPAVLRKELHWLVRRVSMGSSYAEIVDRLPSTSN